MNTEHPIVQSGVDKWRVCDESLAEKMAYVEKKGRKKARILEEEAVKIYQQTNINENSIGVETKDGVEELIKKQLINTPMIDIALSDIDSDLKARFPDIDASILMKDLGKDLIRINELFNVLVNEYGVDKKRTIEKSQKGESVPEPMLRALSDLSKTAWEITLVNAQYILKRTKKIDAIDWKHLDSQTQSDIFSIGLEVAYRLALSHDPSIGITQGKIFQHFARNLKQALFARRKQIDSKDWFKKDWLKIDEKVENEPDPDGLENAVARAVLTKILSEVITSDSTRLTLQMKQVLWLKHLDAPSDINKPTNGEIGKEIGVSGNRVRQIEERAFRKLRRPTIEEKLKDFLDIKEPLSVPSKEEIQNYWDYWTKVTLSLRRQ